MGKRKRQGQFEFLKPPNTWGGRREGAGRKPKGEKAGVSHRPREEFAGDWPLHVTIKVLEGLPSLRRVEEARAVVEVLARCGESEGFRVVECTIMGDHLHMIVEARGHQELRRGVTALCSRLARRLNEVWGRHGRVLSDRYHARLLKTPSEVRNALNYVLHNARNHGVWPWPDQPDPCSTGDCFEGWEDYCARSPRWLPVPVTWLVRDGWRRAGPIRLAWD